MGEGYGHMGCARWVREMGCARWAREMRGLCEMGEGDERVVRDQQGKPEMRELESCA